MWPHSMAKKKEEKKKKEEGNLKTDLVCLRDICVCSVAQSCLTRCDPTDCACQAPLSMEFSRQEYWTALPFPTPI